ncbi:aminoglycoside phosphotransferase family protein [Bacillus sp. SM2101]|uniref:phosphotransferase family protein n=1 Tax=Bacillus sp. SM2101 TaxID=2805366 RepID=UPI001BDEB87E|nr:aminoglycoside phosphotransferase family protein [Bacillus sp. SM2101]
MTYLEQRITKKRWKILNQEKIEGIYAGNIYRIEVLGGEDRKKNYIYKEFAHDRNNEVHIYEKLENLIKPFSKLVEIWSSYPQAILMYDLESPLKVVFENLSLNNKKDFIEQILQRLLALHTLKLDVARNELPIHQMNYEWRNWCIDEINKLIIQHQWAKLDWVETIKYAYEQLEINNYQVKSPLVLTHGDTHLENIFYYEDQISFIDWEWAALGSPLRDITILLQDIYEPELIQFIFDSYRTLLNEKKINIIEKDYREDFNLLYVDHTTMMLAWEIEKYFQGYISEKKIQFIINFTIGEIKRITNEN